MHACDKGFFQPWMWFLRSWELVFHLGKADRFLYSFMEGASPILLDLRLDLMLEGSFPTYVSMNWLKMLHQKIVFWGVLACLCICLRGRRRPRTNHGRNQLCWFLGFLWYWDVGMEMCSEPEQCSWELSEIQGGLRRLQCYLGCRETTAGVWISSWCLFLYQTWLKSAMRFKSPRVGVMRGRDKETGTAAACDSFSLESWPQK